MIAFNDCWVCVHTVESERAREAAFTATKKNIFQCEQRKKHIMNIIRAL